MVTIHDDYHGDVEVHESALAELEADDMIGTDGTAWFVLEPFTSAHVQWAAAWADPGNAGLQV